MNVAPDPDFDFLPLVPSWLQGKAWESAPNYDDTYKALAAFYSAGNMTFYTNDRITLEQVNTARQDPRYGAGTFEGPWMGVTDSEGMSWGIGKWPTGSPPPSDRSEYDNYVNAMCSGLYMYQMYAVWLAQQINKMAYLGAYLAHGQQSA